MQVNETYYNSLKKLQQTLKKDMIKNNKHIIYSLGLVISPIALSMQTVKQPAYTLTSTNPIKQFVIQQHLVLYSATINEQITGNRFKEETYFTIENTTPQDVLHLISCLKKIDTIVQNNTDLPAIRKKRNIAQQALTQYTATLDAQELLTLACSTDYLFIADTHLKESIAQALATKIINAPSDARSILQATPDSFHKNIMQELNKQASIDSILMQSYHDLLEPTCQPPLLHPQYAQRFLLEIQNNIISSDTQYLPRYYNTKTGTTIVGSRSTKLERYLNFQITKKNASQPIIIDTQDLQIKSIVSIKANEDESLFICYVSPQEKSFIINLNNTNSPLVSGYNYYAFKTDDPINVYAASENTFGVLDITKNTFDKIVHFPEAIRHMQLNDDQSTVVIRGWKTIYVGKKAENNTFNFTEIDCTYFTKKHNIRCEYLFSLCLHPRNDKLLAIFNKEGNRVLYCMIDLASLQPTLLFCGDTIKGSPYANQVVFLNDDILYLGSCSHHHFVNLATEHHWSKKTCTQLCYTSDMRHSVESDSTYSNGREHNELRMIPLGDKNIFETIGLLNKGEFPLLLINLAQNKPNTIVTLDDEEEYQEYMQLKQSPLGKIIDSIYTIVQKNRFSYFCGLLRHYCPAEKTLKGCAAAAAFMMIGLALRRGIDYFDIHKRLDSSDKGNLVKGIVNFVLFLMKI